MSLKSAVSISLGSCSDIVGSRLSNVESSKDRLFIFALVSVFEIESFLPSWIALIGKTNPPWVPTFASVCGSFVLETRGRISCNFHQMCQLSTHSNRHYRAGKLVKPKPNTGAHSGTTKLSCAGERRRTRPVNGEWQAPQQIVADALDFPRPSFFGQCCLCDGWTESSWSKMI